MEWDSVFFSLLIPHYTISSCICLNYSSDFLKSSVGCQVSLLIPTVTLGVRCTFSALRWEHRFRGLLRALTSWGSGSATEGILTGAAHPEPGALPATKTDSWPAQSRLSKSTSWRENDAWYTESLPSVRKNPRFQGSVLTMWILHFTYSTSFPKMKIQILTWARNYRSGFIDQVLFPLLVLSYPKIG